MKKWFWGLLLSSTLIWAQKPKLAIHDFDAIGISKSDVAIISDSLRNNLIQTNRFDVLNRKDMKACQNEFCNATQAKKLGIQYLGTGMIGISQSLTSISFHLTDVEKNEVVFSTTFDGNKDPKKEILNAIQKITDDLIDFMVQSSRPAIDPPPLTQPLRGHAGSGLTWIIPYKGKDQIIDIQPNSLGGLEIRPVISNASLTGSVVLNPRTFIKRYYWINHQDHFMKDSVFLIDYMEMNQNERKAILYGRLLYLGSYRIAEEIDLTGKQIQELLQKKHQELDFNIDVDVATVTQMGAKRRAKGVKMGGAFLLTSLTAIIASAILADEDASFYPPLLYTGAAIAVGGAYCSLYYYNVPSDQEERIYQQIQKAYQSLEQND